MFGHGPLGRVLARPGRGPEDASTRGPTVEGLFEGCAMRSVAMWFIIAGAFLVEWAGRLSGKRVDVREWEKECMG